MKLWTGRHVSMLTLVVGVGVAVGGIAYASIPDANGVIHGCYKSDNGVLRVFGKSKDFQQCNAGEKLLDWSQTGPTGPTGPSGAAGATGPTGETGPSDGGVAGGFLFTPIDEGSDITPLDGTLISDLPAGDYIYSAYVHVGPLGSPAVKCQAIGTSPGEWGTTDVFPVQVSTEQSMTVVGALSLFEPQDAQIGCGEAGGNDAYFVVDAALTVIRVGTLHTSLP